MDAVPRIRVMIPAARVAPPRGPALLAWGIAVDAAAGGILVLGAAPPLLLAAAAAHVAAVLLVWRAAGARPELRWVCAAAVATAPLAGAAVAALFLSTTGLGLAKPERRGVARRSPADSAAAIRRIGDALSPCDALERGDAEARRSALEALARRADPEAILLLGRAAAGRDPDLALSAALALDEIRERAERRPTAGRTAELRHDAG